MPESRKLPWNSKAAQKLVEFVGGIEVGFKFAGTEAFAQIVDAAGKQIERDIVLTNREVLSAALDLFARRIDDLRERLGSRELEADFDAANELYKLLRSL